MSDDLAESIVKAAWKMEAQGKAKLIATIRHLKQRYEYVYEVRDGNPIDPIRSFSTFEGAYNFLIRKGFVPASKCVQKFVLEAFKKEISHTIICLMEKPVSDK